MANATTPMNQTWIRIHAAIQADIDAKAPLHQSQYEQMIEDLNVSISVHGPAGETISVLSSDVAHIGDAIGSFSGHHVGLGPFATVISSIIYAGPTLYYAIKNRQLPDSTGRLRLGIALVSIILAELALGVVGGPLVAGIFGLALACIGVYKILQRIRNVSIILNTITEKMKVLSDEINQKLSKKDTYKGEEKEAVVKKMKTYVALAYQYHLAKAHLPVHRVILPITLLVSLTFLAGAVMFFTPVAPLGISLMFITAIIGTIAMCAAWTITQFKQYRLRNATPKPVDKSPYENAVGYDLSVLENTVQSVMMYKLKPIVPLKGTITLEKVDEKLDDLKRIEFYVEQRTKTIAKLSPKCEALEDTVRETQDADLIKRFEALDQILTSKKEEVDVLRKEIALEYGKLGEMRLLRKDLDFERSKPSRAHEQDDDDEGDGLTH